MKFFIVLSLFGATTFAGILPDLQQGILPFFPLEVLDNRITGGEIATPGQFPWQAGLRIEFNPNSYAWCGGTLISEWWVLTAAHCMSGASAVTVFLGAFNITNPLEQGQLRIPSNTFIVHGNYSSSSLKNDIALIKLSHLVQFNEHIQAINLPKKDGKPSTYAGKDVVTSGWGKISDKANSISPLLNFVITDVITNIECNLRYAGFIQPGMICTSGISGKSTCNGDSGGPLVYRKGNESTLIGATSFGSSQGCEKNWPAVYTRITSYLDWIEKNCGVVNN